MAGPTAVPDEALGTAITDAISRLYLDEFGKGPMRTDCRFADDVITLVLHDVYTTVEQKLIDAGRPETVLASRHLWQHATRDTFKASVEQIVGRRVLSVVSGFELQDNMATEVFVLASL